MTCVTEDVDIIIYFLVMFKKSIICETDYDVCQDTDSRESMLRCLSGYCVQSRLECLSKCCFQRVYVRMFVRTLFPESLH